MKNTKNLEAAPEADSDVTQTSEHSEPASPDEADVQELAYRYWEESGRSPGSGDEHWFRAERDIHERSKSLK